MGAAVKKYDNGADETVPPRKSVWSLEFSFHFALSSPASVFWFYTESEPLWWYELRILSLASEHETPPAGAPA